MQTNHQKFVTTLTAEYIRLFQTPQYASAAKLHTPASMAEKFTAGLALGTVQKDGEGVRNTCKALGIKNTYKAIKEFLDV